VSGRTLRVAHIADTHADERNRLDEYVRVHEAMVDQMIDCDVDLVVHAGDWYERRSTPRERNATADWLQRLANHCPVVGVRGNHDADGDLDILSRLETDHPVDILTHPTHSADHGSCVVLALPWIDASHISAALPAHTSRADATETSIQAARRLLELLAAEARRHRSDGRPVILAAHALVGGAEVSTGQRLIGQGIEFSPADLLDVGASYVALGHIHKRQDWHGGRVAYSGSTWRQNQGETEPKGWSLVTCEGADLAGVGFVALPAQAIVHLDADWTDAVTPLDVPAVDGAVVRLRYRIRPERLHEVDEDRLREQIVGCGAAEVAIEPMLVHAQRQRCPELETASDLWEQVQAYWTARNATPGPEQRDRVRAKLSEIETVHAREQEEVDHAAA